MVFRGYCSMNLLSGTNRVVFSIDLDGVLCQYDPIANYYNVVPIKETISKVNKLYDDGHKIIISTARPEIYKSITEIWLKVNNVKYHELFLGKPTADYYVDHKVLKVNEFVDCNFESVSEFIIISWETFLQDILCLCSKIPNDIGNVVAIPRKGLMPAMLIALKLKRKIINFKDVKENDLLIDETIISGATIKSIRKQNPLPKIAVVYADCRTSNLVDYYAREIDFKDADSKRQYILFPWDHHLVSKDFSIDNEGDFMENISEKLHGVKKSFNMPSLLGESYNKENNND